MNFSCFVVVYSFKSLRSGSVGGVSQRRCEYFGESVCAVARRKWMWAGPEETLPATRNTGTMAIQSNDGHRRLCFVFLFSERGCKV